MSEFTNPGHLRPAVGALADKGGKIGRVVARQLFWDALERVAPDEYIEALGHHTIRDASKVWGENNVFAPPLKALAARWGLGKDLIHDLWINQRVAPHCLDSREPLRTHIIVSEFELGSELDALNPHNPQSIVSTQVPVYLLLEDDLTNETSLSWDPLKESRSDAEARLQNDLSTMLKGSLDEIERDFSNTSRGSVCAPVKTMRLRTLKTPP